MFSKTSKRTQPQPKPLEVPKKAPATSGVPSIITADLKVLGDLHSSGDIQIDGTVEGDINSRTLTIGESALVKGAVHAETVRVCGSVEGEVRGTNVAITSTAKIVGDVAHQSLAIEAGAFIEGHLRRLEGEKEGVHGVSSASRSGSKEASVTSGSGATANAGHGRDADGFALDNRPYRESAVR